MEQGDQNMVQIRFQDLQIGHVASSSGVFSGSNRQWGYKHSSKQNQAFGTVDGKHCSISNVNASLNDRDDIDTVGTNKDSMK